MINLETKYTEPNELFIEFFKEKRKQNDDISFSKLERLTGIKRTTLSMMVNHKTGTNLTNVTKILKALNSSLGEFETYMNKRIL